MLVLNSGRATAAAHAVPHYVQVAHDREQQSNAQPTVVGNKAEEHRYQRATHNGSTQQTRGFLGVAAQAGYGQREDGRVHQRVHQAYSQQTPHSYSPGAVDRN